jgi:hypothetical protein
MKKSISICLIMLATQLPAALPAPRELPIPTWIQNEGDAAKGYYQETMRELRRSGKNPFANHPVETILRQTLFDYPLEIFDSKKKYLEDLIHFQALIDTLRPADPRLEKVQALSAELHHIRTSTLPYIKEISDRDMKKNHETYSKERESLNGFIQYRTSPFKHWETLTLAQFDDIIKRFGEQDFAATQEFFAKFQAAIDRKAQTVRNINAIKPLQDTLNTLRRNFAARERPHRIANAVRAGDLERIQDLLDEGERATPIDMVLARAEARAAQKDLATELQKFNEVISLLTK